MATVATARTQGTRNPIFTPQSFTGSFAIDASVAPMTVRGTATKIGILLALAVVGAMVPWIQFSTTRNPALIMPWMLIGSLGGFATAIATRFKQEWSPVTAPLYATLEGLALGTISILIDLRYPGIAMKAVALSFSVVAVMAFLYQSRIVVVTDKLRMGVIAATGGIMIAYLADMVLGFFGIHLGILSGGGMLGIGISLLVVGVAAFNLLLDFDFIEQASAAGAPKQLEWYAAFGIMVTLVWLYLEVLRLLMKLQDRRR